MRATHAEASPLTPNSIILYARAPSSTHTHIFCCCSPAALYLDGAGNSLLLLLILLQQDATYKADSDVVVLWSLSVFWLLCRVREGGGILVSATGF